MSNAHMSLSDITDGLNQLLAHALPLAEMGVVVPVPHDLMTACRNIAALPNTTLGSRPQHHGTSESPTTETPDEAEEIISGPRPLESIRDAVLRVVDADEVSVTDVTSRVEKRLSIHANPSVISNELSRWAKSGHLRKVRSGVYGKPQPDSDFPWPGEWRVQASPSIEVERPMATGSSVSREEPHGAADTEKAGVV